MPSVLKATETPDCLVHDLVLLNLNEVQSKQCAHTSDENLKLIVGQVINLRML